MVVRLKTLFFILVLSVSVFSGTPLGDTGMKESVCPMKCCKRKAKAKKPKNADAKYLCAVLVCSQTPPTNTNSISQVDLAPVIIASEKVSLFEILFSTTPKKTGTADFFSAVIVKESQPKYIQHQRILV